MKLSRPLIYVTRDIERAMGMPPGQYGDAGYYIVTNTSPYAEQVKKDHPDFVWLINAGTPLDTYGILKLPEVESTISKYGAGLLVFKSTTRIESLAKEKSWNLINPPASMSETMENKLTQPAWLGQLASYLPKYSIVTSKNIVWQNTPFILQWGRGHTGDGTILITSQAELIALQREFPDREAKTVTYIDGPVVTANIVVQSNGGVLVGNISYQITGTLPFTDRQFATIGNDWSVAHNIFSNEQIAQISEIAERVGNHASKSGWRGLLGVDIIYNYESSKAYLLEINARQPASTTYESILQLINRSHDIPGATVFEAHIDALLKNPPAKELIQINDGSQIIQRVTNVISKNSTTNTILSHSQKLIDAGYDPISYTNTTIGSDLLRIRSTMSVMEGHLKLNKRGKEIVDIITG